MHDIRKLFVLLHIHARVRMRLEIRLYEDERLFYLDTHDCENIRLYFRLCCFIGLVFLFFFFTKIYRFHFTPIADESRMNRDVRFHSFVIDQSIKKNVTSVFLKSYMHRAFH